MKRVSYPIVKDEAMKAFYQAKTTARANKMYADYMKGVEPQDVETAPVKTAQQSKAISSNKVDYRKSMSQPKDSMPNVKRNMPQLMEMAEAPKSTGSKIGDYAQSKGFSKVEDGSVWDGDTYYNGESSYGIRIQNIHAPEVFNRHKREELKGKTYSELQAIKLGQVKGVQAKSRLEDTFDKYDVYSKDTGQKTYGRPVHEVMYSDGQNFMRLDSMMAVDGFSMPATKYTTPELEKLKQGKWKR